MAALPMAIGCLLGGFFMEKFGRKTAHLLTCIPCIAGWTIIYFSHNLELLLIGRFLTGLCVGLLGPSSSVYIGETSDPKYRGFLLAGISLAIAVGLLLSHILGTFFTWTTTALFCVTLPSVSVVLLSVVPESPSWLAKKGSLKAAVASYHWCRGHSCEANEELAAMLEKQKQDAEEHLSIKQTARMLLRGQFLKPLAIINLFFVTTQFSGVNAITFYSVSIMQDTVGDGLDKYTSMLIIDVIRVLMSVIACVLLRRFGRRPLMIISGFGTAISLFVLTGFIYTSSYFKALSSYSCIPLGALVSYIAFVSVGLVPLPWAMTGEIFPLSLRGFGSGISSSVAFLAFFVVVKTSPMLFSGLGVWGTFFIYGGVAFLGTSILSLYLPETKNKTLQEIEEHFINKTNCDNSDKAIQNKI